ncbi:L,D-transpeptidase family protein [bacterium]|nr:L,D-transpeptidase family protein [bacterium]MBU1990933.1 L,D-transpeptidase family protein [bacterium]
MDKKTTAFILKATFMLLMGLSLHAGDIFNDYRLYGIKHVEKQMDIELTKKEYWLHYLKDKDTKFGYIESYSSILTCNKDKSVLSLYKLDDNKTFGFKKDYSAFTGKIKGDKSKEGDLRTPVGVYHITKKMYDVDSFYGPLAFVTSYPNTYDDYRGKNGSGIWIHGLPTEQERDEFTKGCIAINNAQIECLDRRIDIDNTLLIIHEKANTKEISKEIFASILSQLFSWRYSWLYNDISGYLNFYSSDFIRSDKMDFEQFKKYKTRVFNKNEEKSIIFTNIAIIPYPGINDVYQITFKEQYSSESFTFVGDKTLMVRLDDTSAMNIFTEK